MGGTFSTYSASAHVEVGAPAEVLWDIISDLEAAPRILSQVTSVKRKSGGKFEVGTKWRETRMFKEKEFVQHKTITALTNDNPRSVCVNVSYQEMNSDDVNTSTLSVDATEETSSRLIGTFAFEMATIGGKIQSFFCGRCILRMAQGYFQSEMEEYAAAAEKRYQSQMRGSREGSDGITAESSEQ